MVCHSCFKYGGRGKNEVLIHTDFCFQMLPYLKVQTHFLNIDKDIETSSEDFPE